jgi:hypothetical protein
MTETYTRRQVMELLGLLRMGAVDALAKKYPEAFVRVNIGKSRVRKYDKAALDKFANSRKIFQESIEAGSKR